MVKKNFVGDILNFNLHIALRDESYFLMDEGNIGGTKNKFLLLQRNPIAETVTSKSTVTIVSVGEEKAVIMIAKDNTRIGINSLHLKLLQKKADGHGMITIESNSGSCTINVKQLIEDVHQKRNVHNGI